MPPCTGGLGRLSQKHFLPVTSHDLHGNKLIDNEVKSKKYLNTVDTKILQHASLENKPSLPSIKQQSRCPQRYEKLTFSLVLNYGKSRND